jgi:hypothetical protein
MNSEPNQSKVSAKVVYSEKVPARIQKGRADIPYDL